MTKYYIDGSNKYVGGFDGAQPPIGSIEVPQPPSDARLEWDGSQWIEPLPLKDVFIDEKRESEVIDKGVTLEDKVNALWLKSKGDDSEFDRIESIIVKAEQNFPKL